MKLPVFSRFRRAGPLGPLPSVSRRQFFGASAGAAGVMLGSGLWTPVRSDDDDQGENGEQGEKGQVCPAADPIPHINKVPAAFGAFHFFFPGPADGSTATTDPEGTTQPNGRDPSTIFDFDGVIGQADLELNGTGTDTTTMVSTPYRFHTDMRFMAGKFVGTDGRVHKGAFAFI
ncbi:MAG: hypothetical protein DMF80_06460 [Acidobacteria bacterium]|nr:MAG: hypothetical protein DMF80_06460 [Acidobacteriota bacterium]PYQ20578.1 MAG: hypothetical protein DMF81_18210 [Acidobacteriota bacterium]